MKLYLASPLLFLSGISAIRRPKNDCDDFLIEKVSRGNSDYEESSGVGSGGDLTDYSSSQDSILLFLDETGSMRKIKTDKKGKQIGKQVVSSKMTELIGDLKSTHDNIPITIVKFNKKATWMSYDKVSDVPNFKSYDPKFATNLYDAMGCGLSKYADEHGSENVKVYVISDGIHDMGKLKYDPAYSQEDVRDMVEELKDENNWEFQFYGATNDNKKAELKSEAQGLGFNRREVRVFDFNGKGLGVLMKTMAKSIGKKVSGNQIVPECEKCSKGKKGKKCRKNRKQMIATGKCVKL